MKKINEIIEQSKKDEQVHIAALMIIDGVTYSFGSSFGKSQFVDIASSSLEADEQKLNQTFFSLLKPLANTYVNHLERGNK